MRSVLLSQLQSERRQGSTVTCAASPDPVAVAVRRSVSLSAPPCRVPREGRSDAATDISAPVPGKRGRRSMALILVFRREDSVAITDSSSTGDHENGDARKIQGDVVRRQLMTRASASVAGVLVGLAATAGVGVAVGSGRFAGVSDDEIALQVLRADSRDLASIVEKVSQASRLADLQEAGRSAAELASGSLRDRETKLVTLDDETVKGGAVLAHASITDIVAGYGNLEDVSADDLDAWDQAERAVIDALGQLDAASTAVVALSPEQPLHIETRDPEDAAEHASLLLTTAARKLARYEKKLAAFRRRHRRDLKVASDYQVTVSAQIGFYNATRRNLQRYLDAVKDDDEAIPVFRNALQDARREREGVRATLASITAPTPLAADHQRLISLLDRAISATDVGVELADAVQELRDFGDYETGGFELPEYQRFVDLSDDITQERNAAVASWQAATERHIDRLQGSRGGPKKPKI